MRRTTFPVGATVALMAALLPAAQQPPTLDTLLARAGQYVQFFVTRFSNIVAEERYVQEFSTPPRRPALNSTASLLDRPMQRTLKSDFLLVRMQTSEDWVAFRDVFEVDGQPVRDREQRLTKLFLEPSGNLVDRVNEIADESARYTFGGSTRTLNNPLVALAFLQQRYQSRFRFTLRKLDRDVGADAWILDYEEFARPTILRASRRGRPDRDLVAHGRYWIDRETGRVLKSELKAEANSIVTIFRFDDAFQIAVPVEMHEIFSVGAGHVNGTATYSRFRRFEVRTEEKLQ